jgi:hypothetical protein
MKNSVTTSDTFTIDRVGWHTRVQGNPETKEHIDLRFRELFAFLERHSLLAPGAPLPPATGALPDEFEINTRHLTHEGLQVMREGYDRWVSALDHGTAASKVTILENALKRVRKHRA